MASLLHRHGVVLALALLLTAGLPAPAFAQQVRLTNAQVDDLHYCAALYMATSEDGRNVLSWELFTRLVDLKSRAGVSDEVFNKRVLEEVKKLAAEVVSAPDQEAKVRSLFDDCARRLAGLPD